MKKPARHRLPIDCPICGQEIGKYDTESEKHIKNHVWEEDIKYNLPIGCPGCDMKFKRAGGHLVGHFRRHDAVQTGKFLNELLKKRSRIDSITEKDIVGRFINNIKDFTDNIAHVLTEVPVSNEPNKSPRDCKAIDAIVVHGEVSYPSTGHLINCSSKSQCKLYLDTIIEQRDNTRVSIYEIKKEINFRSIGQCICYPYNMKLYYGDNGRINIEERAVAFSKNNKFHSEPAEEYIDLYQI